MSLALCLALLAPATAQDELLPRPVTHILMLDVSGSLRDRGYAVREGGATRWTETIPSFLGKLFQPGGELFEPQDLLIVQPFSDANTDAREGRVPEGPMALSEFDATSLPTPGAGATDMARALDIAEGHARSDGTTLIWVLTDNENNLRGNRSDAQFYERLRGSPDYTHVYFFPLSDPETGRSDALVMYLLVHAGPESTAWVDELVEEVAERTGYEGMLFRPLYSGSGEAGLSLGKDLEYSDGAENRATHEAGTTVLHFNEGDRLRGQLRFKVHSNLKGWEIVDATLEDARVNLDIPRVYTNSGKQSLTWKITTPRDLTVAPQQSSVNFYILSLQDKPFEVERSWSQKLRDPLAKYLPDIEGKIAMRAVVELSPSDIEESQIRPSFTPQMRERVRYVPNLGEIEHFMVYQEDLSGETEEGVRTIDFERRLVIRVKASPLPRLLLFGGLGLLLLMALALVWVLFLWRRRYTLEAPEGVHDLDLPALYGSYLICDPSEIPLAHLRLRLGNPALEPEPDVLVDGEEEAPPLTFEGDEARFELAQQSRKESHFYVLTRKTGSGSAGAVAEDVEL